MEHCTVSIFFVDFEKIFDPVDQGVLWKTLQHSTGYLRAIVRMVQVF